MFLPHTSIHAGALYVLLPLTQQQLEGAVITPILQLRKLKLGEVSHRVGIGMAAASLET